MFQSFFLGGVECSTHINGHGRRLDLVHATRHDELASQDFRLLAEHGLRTVREGLRWHLIEPEPGRYDFSSVLPIIRAAQETGTQVIWDFWHYGWPIDLDIFGPEFVERFVRFALAATDLIAEYSNEPIICPLNEISFFAWAGGEVGAFFPFARGRGDELKRQLVRASLAAIHALRSAHPRLRICHIDPIIHVIAGGPEDVEAARALTASQFEACDMILGRAAPELGGREDLIDLVGVNYYIHNQWSHAAGAASMLVPSDPRYRHLRDLLQENHARYGKPIFVAETGIEDEARPAWLRYICHEVDAAEAAGVPVEGICWYPILNHPGWDDDRHCHNGLFDYADAEGQRPVYTPLARELAHRQETVRQRRAGKTAFIDRRATEGPALDWAAHVMRKRTEEGRAA